MTSQTVAPEAVASEAARRRTFAIISHPDAGKTTITEKLLLYGGAIQSAGNVTAKAGTTHTRSDWMSMEQQRGISISSSALSFEYAGRVVNLLDTPGHQDFSEDTFRTLVAADAALMVLDGARGVQEQTEKLFAVCRNRSIPIFTFVNKMDRPALDPFELLEQLEGVLGIRARPLTWPIGDGPDFRGVYDLTRREVLLFERTAGGKAPVPVQVSSLGSPELAELIGADAAQKLQEDAELIEGVMEPFSADEFLAGQVTPVFFGSAITNFGVEHFLGQFVQMAPPPAALPTTAGPREVTAPFTGFVFKLQANMSRAHRDRTAYMRIATGKFERGMDVIHTRSGRSLRLSRAHSLFAQDKESVEEAYPGDIVGLVNPGVFRIGDVVSLEKGVHVPDFPTFTPELFSSCSPRDVGKRKAFLKGLEQLAEEGVVQLYFPTDGAREPLLGAVGQLQFEVLEHRMQEEYGVELMLNPTSYRLVRWVDGDTETLARFARNVEDASGRPVMLFTSTWDLEYTEKQHPELKFLPQPRDLTSIN